jgi:hypothetical protein
MKKFFLSLALLILVTFPLAAQDIKLILHADDIGMSHSVNRATFELLESGSISSASVMMPCAWVSEVATWSKKHPEMDLGVHLTLTSEWTTLRWAPVAPRDKVPGLIDEDGYMYRSVREVAMNATAEEVEIELRAQIEKAKQMGIRFTHIDTHMGTLYARPDYFEVYAKLGREYGVPIMLPKPNDDLRGGAPNATIDYLITNQNKIRDSGVYMLDYLITDGARQTKTPEEAMAAYKKTLSGLKPGVTMMIIHPGRFDPELRAATSSAWRRNADFEIFMKPEMQKFMKEKGIELVGWQDVAPAKKQTASAQ